jgi:DNA-binding transcriptional MocR family regulator
VTHRAEILELARRRGVEMTLPVSAYAVTRAPQQSLVIGYGAVRTERIPEGLRRLRDCIG